MRANGVIGNEYISFIEKVGSVRKEVGFHGFVAMIVKILRDCHSLGICED